MIPLILLALVASAGLAAYEFSPRAHAWVDDHLQALRDALAAHHAADAQLQAAKAAQDPAVAAEHAQAAQALNQEAAQKTAVAASTAQTAPQQQAVSDSAAMANRRGNEIAHFFAGLASMASRAGAWIDEHVSALERAHLAHRAADVHVDAAKAAPDATTAASRAKGAQAMNQVAAHDTGVAASTAQTAPQRHAAATSAVAVANREKTIDDLHVKIGVGQCDVRTYPRVTPQVKDAILAKLHAAGMTITGDNPYDIDTHKYDVKLRALLLPSGNLQLIVTAGKGGMFGLVTCDAIWSQVDPILKEVMG